jgi:hypothetical protein
MAFLVIGLAPLYILLTALFANLFGEYKGYILVFYDAMSGGNFQQYGLALSKGVMFVTGLVCSFFFFLLFYVFFYAIVSNLWNTYFVRPHDDYKLILLVVLQLIDYAIVIWAPHFWYLSVSGLYIVYLMILYVTYKRYERILSSKGLYLSQDNIEIFIVECERKLGDEYRNVLGPFFLIRFCLQRYIYFGLFFGSPFIVIMGASQYLRRRVDAVDLEWLQTGAYVTAAVLFTLMFCFYFLLRLKVMDRTAERLDAKDYGYFLRIVR